MEQFYRDEFCPEISFQVNESSEVDGEHILAKISGQFFVPNGKSRNGRYYTEKLWQKVINNSTIRSLLEDRRMFGTISHDQEIDDKALLDGKLSHIVTKLDIQPGKDGKIVGFGEALVLNTPAGRILNTVVRANSKLFVSSRAFGRHQGMVDGVPKVDEDTYDFRTFDFVLEPGFLEANPKLAESYDKLVNETGDKTMGEVNKQLVDNLVSENKELKAELSNALSELERYKNDNISISEENAHIKDQVKALEEYKALGEVSAIVEELEGLKTKLAEAVFASNELQAVVEEYKALGEVKEIDEVFNIFAESKSKLIELTEAKTVPEALVMIEKAIDLATDMIKSYTELGSVEEIKKLVDKHEQMNKEVEEAKRVEKIRVLAESLEVSEDLVTKVYDKMSEEEIKEFFTKAKKESKTVAKYSGKRTNEKVENKTTINESRGSRIMRGIMS